MSAYVKKYSTLFIDLDDTLFDFQKASREAFSEIYDLLNYKSFFDSFEHFWRIYEPYNKELWRLYGTGQIDKEELNRRRYSYPLEVVGIFDKELAALFGKKVLKLIPYKNMLVPGVIDLLDYLYPKYEMYILSNGFKELQYRKMETVGIVKYFKRVILSEDIGINKPNPELFRYALSIVRNQNRNCLMIGDSFEADIVGAANAGIDQLFFNRSNLKECFFTPTYEVENLYEIKNIL